MNRCHDTLADQQAALYRQLVDESSDAIFAINRETRVIVYANKTLSRLLGGVPCMGQTCHQMLHGHDAPCHACIMDRAEETMQPAEERFAGRDMLLRVRSDEWAGVPVRIVIATDITERKAMEQALRQNEQRYRLAIEGAGVDVWEYDFANRRLIQSPESSAKHACARVVDNMPESHIESGYILPEEAERLRNIFRRLEAGEGTVSGDFLVPRSDGEGRWYERATYSAVYDNAGKAIWAYGVSQDITQFKQLENRYNDELRYRDESAGSVLGSCSVNLTRSVVEFLRVGGQHIRELSGCHATDFREVMASFLLSIGLSDEQNQNLSAENLIHLYKSGVTSHSETYPVQLKAGRHLWMRTDVNLVSRPDSGEIIAFFYHQDVTEEKTLQCLVEQLVRTEYDAICRVNAQSGAFVMFAKKANVLTLPSAGDSYNDALATLFHEHVKPGAFEDIFARLRLETIVQALAENPLYAQTFDILEADGQWRRKEYHFFFMDETRSTVVMTRSDVDDLVKKEQAKQEQLEQALASAEAANRAKSEFMARMSHDMRTPMNGIIGMTRLGLDALVDEKARYYLENVKLSTEILLDLVNDVLDMAHLEGGSLTLHPTPYAFEDFRQHLETAIRPQCEAKQLAFTMRLVDTQSCKLLLDKARFNQIFFNLLTNAVKFTPLGGGINFDASLHEVHGNTPRLVIVVRDTGIGMSQAFQNRMFDPFAREQEGVTDDTEGSGLGLSITQKLLELMGGTITVQSAPGKGSTFTVEMPVERCPDNAPREPGSPPEPGAPLAGSANEARMLAGKRVLLFEDHFINTEIAISLLENRGMLTEHAVNGQVGVDMFSTSPVGYYDVVLMDIRMPVMDGLEATRRIRGLLRPDALVVPILALSANAYDEDRQQSRAAGMNDHLVKPIDADTLYAALHEVLFRQTPGSSPTTR